MSNTIFSGQNTKKYNYNYVVTYLTYFSIRRIHGSVYMFIFDKCLLRFFQSTYAILHENALPGCVLYMNKFVAINTV